MMTMPKFLAELTLTDDADFAFNTGIAEVATVPAGHYDSMLELLAALETELQALWATFTVEVSTAGVVTIAKPHAVNLWSVDWVNTSAVLAEMLGFDGTESVTGNPTNELVGSRKHRYAWYAPVPVEYPGVRRKKSRKYTPTEGGSASVYAGGGAAQKYVDLFFDALLEPQVEPDVAATAGDVSDGYGGTIDWTGGSFYDFWEDVTGAKFRWYADAADGVVGTPGTEGTEFQTCVRTDEESEPSQLDPDGYTYFRVSLPVQIIGS